jgi:hypothetical protein
MSSIGHTWKLALAIFLGFMAVAWVLHGQYAACVRLGCDQFLGKAILLWLAMGFLTFGALYLLLGVFLLLFRYRADLPLSAVKILKKYGATSLFKQGSERLLIVAYKGGLWLVSEVIENSKNDASI